MSHERDERWAYVVLAVLAAAYVVYKYAGAEAFGDVTWRLPDLRGGIGKFGKAIPYLVAPLFAVLSEIYRRRRARIMKAEWDRRLREEGLVRRQDNVEIRFRDGISGKIHGDVIQTRLALYVVDGSWHREPTRLVFEPSRKGEPVVQEVAVAVGARPELSRVLVRVGGPARFTAEFESTESDAWASDIGRRVRRPMDSPAVGQLDGEPEIANDLDRY